MTLVLRADCRGEAVLHLFVLPLLWGGLLIARITSITLTCQQPTLSKLIFPLALNMALAHEVAIAVVPSVTRLLGHLLKSIGH